MKKFDALQDEITPSHPTPPSDLCRCASILCGSTRSNQNTLIGITIS